VRVLARAISPRGRVLGLVGALLLVGAPAALLRATCAGRSCEDPGKEGARVPFCSLPAPLQRALEAGFREGRSPDLFVVDRSSAAFDTGERVPIVFSGAGVAEGASIPAGTELDRIAPTIAEILGFKRTHPEVRSGSALDGFASGAPPRLVLEVVWKNGDARTLRAAEDEWPFLRSLFEDGAGSLDGLPGSVPLDPAATMTTIGTGGLPYQHGISGQIIRSDSGRAVYAWGPKAPTSIIATLPDDLDEALDQNPRIGLLETAPSDMGLIGGHWYLKVDHDDVVDSADGAKRLLAAGYGDDATPDFFGAVVSGSPAEVDGRLAALVRSAADAAGGRLLTVFTATGGAGSSRAAMATLAERVPEIRRVIEATTAGGLFLDQDRLARSEIREDDVVNRLDGASPTSAVDIFSDRAISFARYC
jgi:hypothetical protein